MKSDSQPEPQTESLHVEEQATAQAVAVNRRKITHRHWLQGSVALGIAGMAALLVPGMDHAVAQAHGVDVRVAPLPLPRSASVAEHGSWTTVNLRQGESLRQMLSTFGVSRSQMDALLRAPELKATLAQFKPGAEISIDAPGNGLLRAMRFRRGDDRVQVSLVDGKVQTQVIPAETQTRTVVLTGTVGDDLWSAAAKAGLTDANVSELTNDIFRYDIDFDSDLAAADRFSVVVDQTWKNGQLVETSPVLAAAFTVDGVLHTGFRHLRDGKPEYFNAAGVSLKRPFIRMPIAFARMSSGFGTRMHPILGRMKMHKGIDYAAPIGTPIMAAGDARVKSVGQVHGYGNTVELDHGGGKTTFYAHMSRYAGIHVGQQITQGTVIGYVGSTGMSTGPHLHYEFRVNGVYQNPLSVMTPPPEPLSGDALVAFRQETQKAMDKIRTVEKIIYPGMMSETRVAMLAPALRRD